MAVRIVFRPGLSSSFEPNEIPVEFTWVPGMAKSQIQKSLSNLHREIVSSGVGMKPLEVSTKSIDPIGVAASAMNLKLDVNGQKVSVESVYQSSKVFENGGPFLDLINVPSFDAKRDERLKNSGRLVGFNFDDEIWSLTDGVSFYDWLFINALNSHENVSLAESLLGFDCFTDINYSQTKTEKKHGRSFNCQARSVAMFASAHLAGSVGDLLDGIKGFCFSAVDPETLF